MAKAGSLLHRNGLKMIDLPKLLATGSSHTTAEAELALRRRLADAAERACDGYRRSLNEHMARAQEIQQELRARLARTEVALEAEREARVGEDRKRDAHTAYGARKKSGNDGKERKAVKAHYGTGDAEWEKASCGTGMKCSCRIWKGRPGYSRKSGSSVTEHFGRGMNGGSARCSPEEGARPTQHRPTSDFDQWDAILSGRLPCQRGVPSSMVAKRCVCASSTCLEGVPSRAFELCCYRGIAGDETVHDDKFHPCDHLLTVTRANRAPSAKMAFASLPSRDAFSASWTSWAQ